MSTIDLQSARSLLSWKMDDEAESKLFKELLVVILSRASSVDYHTCQQEVSVIQNVIHEYTGELISQAEIRVAAAAEMFGSVPLSKYISRNAAQLTEAHRKLLVKALDEVLRADSHIRAAEIGYFNLVVRALGGSYADAAGLVEN